MTEPALPPTAAEDRHFAAELQEYVYGTLTVMVAIGGLTGSSVAPDPREAIAVILGVAVATLLAHSFSAIVGFNVAQRRKVEFSEVATELGHSWRIVTATFPSIVVLVLAALGVFGTRTALRLSTLLAVAALVVVGVIAARRTMSTLLGSVIYVGLGTLMGLAIVAIELYVHHL